MNYDDPDWVPAPMQGMRGFHKDDPEWLDLQKAMRGDARPTHGGQLLAPGEIGKQVAAIFRGAFLNDSTKA